MGLKELAEALKDFVSGVLESLRKALAQLFYTYHRLRAPDYQQEHLPKDYNRYEHYHTTYGVAPGDAYDTERGPIVVTDITGPPHINAKVTYIELEKDIERKMGLVAFYHATG